MKQTPDEIDLHGRTVDEAIPLVDAFLQRAFKAGLHCVWVIHGRGTGVLRSEVWRHLTGHPLVRQCTTADGKRGGVGATAVYLAN